MIYVCNYKSTVYKLEEEGKACKKAWCFFCHLMYEINQVGVRIAGGDMGDILVLCLPQAVFDQQIASRYFGEAEDVFMHFPRVFCCVHSPPSQSTPLQHCHPHCLRHSKVPLLAGFWCSGKAGSPVPWGLPWFTTATPSFSRNHNFQVASVGIFWCFLNSRARNNESKVRTVHLFGSPVVGGKFNEASLK